MDLDVRCIARLVVLREVRLKHLQERGMVVLDRLNRLAVLLHLRAEVPQRGFGQLMVPPVLAPLLASEPKEDTDADQEDFETNLDERFSSCRTHRRTLRHDSWRILVLEFWNVSFRHVPNATPPAHGLKG